jgi:hypothetical protein
VSTQLVVSTANVLRGLPSEEAGDSLDKVLAHHPDIVGLQEWGLRRLPILRGTGAVRVVPGRLPALPARNGGAYSWCASVLGGCVVGARSDRFVVVKSRLALLDPPGRAERPDRWLGIEPPRFAMVATYDDRATGERTSVVSFHLVARVQSGADYREDWLRLVARHRHEVRALQKVVDEERERSDDVYAVGDSNFDGLRLRGLRSAWEDRDRPGTLGRRSVDDVFATAPAASVHLVDTPSDHRALVVTR